MSQKQLTYKVEKEAERLLRQVRIGIKQIINFFFKIPRNKMDKYIYVIETISWLFLTFALIWRLL